MVYAKSIHYRGNFPLSTSNEKKYKEKHEDLYMICIDLEKTSNIVLKKLI